MTTEQLYTYRILLLLKPDLAEKEYTDVVGGVSTVIEKANGSMKHQDLWGVRDLAYPIAQYDKGYYAHLLVVASPGSVKQLQSALNLNERALRFMITRDE